MKNADIIYKICSRGEWESAERKNRFTGSAIDVADGFIHFSTKDQMKETAAKHFAGQPDLLLIAVSVDKLGAELRWEESRGGDTFPHLYGDLLMSAVISVSPLPIGSDGLHQFPV